MSSTIWTRCAASSEAIGPLRAQVVRVVESQWISATRKLVDTSAEHDLLEDMLEEAKPGMPEGARGLHYLLSTPFRYPPLRHGSRFGRRHERGIWYGSLTLPTALSEAAYYRLVFIEGSEAFGPDARLVVELSSFQAMVDAQRAVDLTAPAFADYQDALRSTTSYAETHALGSAMREAGIQAFLFASARDPQGGTNAGLFEPAFADDRPTAGATFLCYATARGVELTEKTLARDRLRARFAFARADFEVDGQLPMPAV